MRSSAFRQLAETAADRYRAAGRFAHGFARGKLLGDPAFEYLLTQGLLTAPGAATATAPAPVPAPASAAPPAPSAPTSATANATVRPVRILDLGCGQCLLAALLPAAVAAHRRGEWPPDWPPPPQAQLHGIELMASDVARARAALGDWARIEAGDITTAPYSAADVVVILDVLHYIDYAAQERVLQRVAQSLAPHGGRLLLRVGDAAGGWRFRASQWVDALVTFVRGHRLGRLYCRSLADWRAALQRHGFQVRTQALSAGTPFANVLLIAEQPAAVPSGAADTTATAAPEPDSGRRNGPSSERPQTLPA